MPIPFKLEKYHKRAMELRYSGRYSYVEIAEKLQDEFGKKPKKVSFNEDTLKNWFRTEGELYEVYREHEKEQDELNKEAFEIIKKAGLRVRAENFRIANEMLVALLGSDNDAVKLGAIKELFDRTEGRPTQKTQLEIVKTLEDYAKEYYERKNRQ